MFSGATTITEGTFLAGRTPYRLRSSSSGPSGSWTADMDTTMLRLPLEEQVYVGALGPFQQFGHPEFELSGNAKACGRCAGTFHIQRLVDANSAPSDLLVTFEQYCDQETVPLRGCLRYTAPLAR